MGRALTAPTLDDVRAARDRIGGTARRTPLLRLEGGPGAPEIHLKLENLQPIGSFKLRGALNRIRALPRAQLRDGVYTASAGNMAQGVAWAARELGISASVVVPDSAPQAKLEAITRLGAAIVSVPYEEWWRTMQHHGRAGMRGAFVHPFADRDVMAGNGTIALEVQEELEGIDAILVPWGGGGLTCGIAAAARQVMPATRVYACEVEQAAPLQAALAAGAPVAIENRRTFVDGIGGRGVFPEIWELARDLVAGSLVSPLSDVARAVALLATRVHVIAEGAGAAPVAAAVGQVAKTDPAVKRVVCIVSGGNIDAAVLASILTGSVP